MTEASDAAGLVTRRRLRREPGGPATRSAVGSSSRWPPTVRSRSRAAARSTTSTSPTRPGARSTTTASNAMLCATRGPATATPPGRSGPATSPPGWWEGVVGPGLPIDTDRYFVVCANVARRLPGLDRPGVDRPVDRPAVRLALPGRHDPRHGARAGRARRPPRDRAVALRGRRLDGRHAGARVGRHVSRPGAVARADRDLRAGDRAADRAGGSDRAPGDPARPEAGGAATTTTPRPATVRTRASRSPA